MANIRVEFVRLGNITPGQVDTFLSVQTLASANATDTKVTAAVAAVASGSTSMTARVIPFANAYVGVSSSNTFAANSTNSVWCPAGVPTYFKFNNSQYVGTVLA